MQCRALFTTAVNFRDVTQLIGEVDRFLARRTTLRNPNALVLSLTQNSGSFLSFLEGLRHDTKYAKTELDLESPLGELLQQGLVGSGRTSNFLIRRNSGQKETQSAKRPDFVYEVHHESGYHESKSMSSPEKEQHSDRMKMIKYAIEKLFHYRNGFSRPASNRPFCLILTQLWRNFFDSWILAEAGKSTFFLFEYQSVDFLEDTFGTILVRCRIVRDTVIAIGQSFSATQRDSDLPALKPETDYCPFGQPMMRHRQMRAVIV